MKAGRIVVISLALVALANVAQAKYDRALDGKTKIWHNVSDRGVQPSWSGDRDEKGYATGEGTLTWFRVRRNWETGSLLPKTKYIEISQYKGTMVEGKLEGSVVREDSRGNTYHAKFAAGEKAGDWVAGTGRSSHKRTNQAASTAPKVAEAPAEAPKPAVKLNEPAAHKQPEEKQPEQAPPIAETQSSPANDSATKTEDSLQALAKPPSSLRIASTSESSSQAAAPTVDVGEQHSTAAISSSPASAAASSANSAESDDARAVAALDSEFHTAVKTNDAATIDRILSDDFVLVHGGGRNFSKNDVLKQAREKQARYEHHEIEPGSQKVRVWRDTAVVTGTLWIKGSQNGQSVDEKMSVTETYVRTPNGWRYVSGQASTPAP